MWYGWQDTTFLEHTKIIDFSFKTAIREEAPSFDSKVFLIDAFGGNGWPGKKEGNPSSWADEPLEGMFLR
jgi:hypothetical protein